MLMTISSDVTPHAISAERARRRGHINIITIFEGGFGFQPAVAAPVVAEQRRLPSGRILARDTMIETTRRHASCHARHENYTSHDTRLKARRLDAHCAAAVTTHLPSA